MISQILSVIAFYFLSILQILSVVDAKNKIFGNFFQSILLHKLAGLLNKPLQEIVPEFPSITYQMIPSGTFQMIFFRNSITDALRNAYGDSLEKSSSISTGIQNNFKKSKTSASFSSKFPIRNAFKVFF